MFPSQLQILTLLYFFFLHHSILIYAGNFPNPNSPVDNVVVYYDYDSLPPRQKLVLAFGRGNTIATVLIIVIVLLDIIVYKLRQFFEAKLGDKLSEALSRQSEQQCRHFSFAEIQLATHNFKSELVLGQGAFGKVYKGFIDNGATTVAIKRLNPMSNQGAPEFWTEIKTLSKIRHSHIVSLIGYCNNSGEMILVYEYIVHGTLADHLYKIGRNGNDSTLSWVQRLKICIGAAHGLDYLHTGTGVQHRVIHRDVKSSNILLDENWIAKISDFGLSKIGPANQSCTQVTTSIKGTLGYMDREYILTRKLTRKSDVYAFGVVLFEVLCGRRAVDFQLDVKQRSLAKWAQQCIQEGTLNQIIDPSLMEQILPESLKAFAQIADQCLHKFSKKRPTMAEVVVSLERALALQGRRYSSMLEGYNFNSDWASNNQENTDSFLKQQELQEVSNTYSLEQQMIISDSNRLEHILVKQIRLADQVTKGAEEAEVCKQDCAELKSKTEKLAALLRQAARASNDLYERPTCRIIDNIERILVKALALVQKCIPNSVVKRVFTIIPAAAFRKMFAELENSICDVSWLVRVSANSLGDEYLGLPPIASNEPNLCYVWEQIAILYTSCLDDRADAAAALASLSRDNDRYGKLIIEEGGVGPLLKLVKEGKLEGQENAARAIGLLGRLPESVVHMIHSGVCQVFAEMLKEGPMKVQAVVAWAVSELAAHSPKCQYLFLQHNIIGLLVGHLAFETLEEHSKYTITSNQATSGATIKGRELEDPSTKEYMKKMASRALWHLAKENSPICRSITESRAILCFAVLLEKGPPDVRFNSAMAFMEITAVAEHDPELRRSAFKSNSSACKAVSDQLLNIIEKDDSELLIPCVKSIGNLARTFRATETRMISLLVKLLDEREVEISKEACIALTKFACNDNFFRLDHSKAIINAGGTAHLVQLVYFGEQIVQGSAAILLCYIALHVPDSEELALAEVLTVLEWASKQANLIQDEMVESLMTLLLGARGRMELYQSRGHRARGFH